MTTATTSGTTSTTQVPRLKVNNQLRSETITHSSHVQQSGDDEDDEEETTSLKEVVLHFADFEKR